MAVPNDRRIIWGTHVIPQEEYTNPGNQETLEDGMTVGVPSYTDYKLDTTVGKRFGGKGNTDITSEQVTDSWTSMLHSSHYWELLSDTWDAMDETWDGEELITGSKTIRSDAGKVKFLYIKNTGSTEDVNLVLDGSNAFILIPPGGSISLRPNYTYVDTSEVLVSAGGSGSTIEYVIAI